MSHQAFTQALWRHTVVLLTFSKGGSENLQPLLLKITKCCATYRTVPTETHESHQPLGKVITRLSNTMSDENSGRDKNQHGASWEQRGSAPLLAGPLLGLLFLLLAPASVYAASHKTRSPSGWGLPIHSCTAGAVHNAWASQTPPELRVETERSTQTEAKDPIIPLRVKQLHVLGHGEFLVSNKAPMFIISIQIQISSKGNF